MLVETLSFHIWGNSLSQNVLDLTICTCPCGQTLKTMANQSLNFIFWLLKPDFLISVWSEIKSTSQMDHTEYYLTLVWANHVYQWIGHILLQSGVCLAAERCLGPLPKINILCMLLKPLPMDYVTALLGCLINWNFFFLI